LGSTINTASRRKLLASAAAAFPFLALAACGRNDDASSLASSRDSGPIYTTTAVGENGDHITTTAVGETGGHVTTALEEDGIAWPGEEAVEIGIGTLEFYSESPPRVTTALGEDGDYATTTAVGESGIATTTAVGESGDRYVTTAVGESGDHYVTTAVGENGEWPNQQFMLVTENGSYLLNATDGVLRDFRSNQLVSEVDRSGKWLVMAKLMRDNSLQVYKMTKLDNML